jgi:uncharacterized protein YqjF (DUF2071 family)
VSLRDAADLLAAPAVQGRVTRVAGHRPWPLPDGRWVMAQTWCNLLFAHWSFPPATLRAVLPQPLELDTFGGRAWLGVTPFAVRNLRPRVTPPVPFLSSFPEINVRTYVSFGGRPGIWFFSLDADSALAVAAARRGYRLPYFRARMAIRDEGPAIVFTSERAAPEAPAPARFTGRYRPTGPASPPRPGTLEAWLTERYCLYTFDSARRVRRADIHHPPWPLQPASGEIDAATMAAEIGLELGAPELLHYARRQDVVFWPPARV